MEGTEPTSGRRGGMMGVILLIVGLIIGLLAGYFSGALLAPGEPARAEATFTVVAYHWGFAIYDENGIEVPKMEVSEGTEVTLLLIGGEALSHDLHEIYEERTIEAWEDNPDFGNLNHTELHEEMEDAEAQGLHEHGVRIAAFGVEEEVGGESASPTIVTFIADETGSFDIVCQVFCGFGHQYMVLSGGLVVS